MVIKRKWISYVLVFTLFLGLIAPINGLNVVWAEDTDTNLTYQQLKNAVNTLLEKVSSLDSFERTFAIAVLKNYAKVTEDVDPQNGIDDGIDALSNIVANLDTDDTFPETLTSRVVTALDLRGISLEQAAKAVKLLSIWDADARVTLIESLDSEHAVKLFDQGEEQFIEELLAKSPETVDLFREILEDEGITLNEFTFFAFAARLAIGQPIFTDDSDGLLKLIDDNRFNHVKDTMETALEGLTIGGKTFSVGTVDQIFDKAESVLKNLLAQTSDVNTVKEIFAKYDLYQSIEPTIKLVPVYRIIGENQAAEFDIVLRNVEEEINSLQFKIDYNDFLRFTEFKVFDQAITESLETSEYIAVLDTDNAGTIAFGITYLNEGSIPLNSEVKIASVSFTGNAIGLGEVNFDDENFIALAPDNSSLDFPLNSYGAVVEVREVTDVEVPEITGVYFDGNQISLDDDILINTGDFTVSGFVVPKTATVKVNNQTVAVDGLTGKFTYDFTGFTGGEITIIATNENLTDEFTFDVVVDEEAPVITISGVEDGGLYKTDKAITFSASNSESTTATLNGAEFGDGESTVTPDNTKQLYELVVIAVDEAGNEATSTISFTVDKEKAVIEGVVDGQITNDQFIPTSSADDIKTVVLKKNGVQQLSYTLGTAITAEGDYVLTITDKAGNASTVSFTIDKSALVVEGVVNGGFYQEVTPECIEADTFVLFKDSTEVSDYELGDTLTEEGTYELTVTDIAGNPTPVTFTIDTTAPTATVSYDITDATNQNVIATLDPNEEVTVTNNGGLTTYTFTANGDFTFQFKDLAGNTGEATANVDYIDKTPPVITFNNITNNGNYDSVIPDVNTDDAAATITVKDLLKDGSPVSGYALVDVISTEGYYILTVTATDEAKNSSEKSISFFIDTPIAPIITFTNIQADAYYTSITPEIELSEGNITETILTKDGTAVDGYNLGNITEDGYYTLTVTAESGLESDASISFYIDGTLPEITFENITEDEYYQHITPQVSLSEGNITTVALTKDGVNVAGYVLGNPPISESGNYTLTVTAADEVNTFSRSISFHIDSTPPVISVSDNSIANNLVQIDSVTPKFTITDVTESTLLYTIEKTVDGTTTLDSGEVNKNAQGYYVLPEISAAADYKVIVKAIDAVGNMSQEVVYSFVIAAPAIPSGSLNIVPKAGSSEDPEYTNNTTVDLVLNVLNTASIEVSNDEDFGVEGTESYPVNSDSVNLEWNLAAVNADSTETRTVYVKLISETGSEVVLSDSITIDKDVPVITNALHTAGEYLKAGDNFTISAQLDNQNEIVHQATVKLFDGADQPKGEFILEKGFGGYLFYNYTVPVVNNFTIDKLVFNVTDKAGNASAVYTETLLANNIKFMGSAKVTFSNASSDPVSDLSFNLNNNANVFRSGSIYNTNEYTFNDLPVGTYTLEWYPLTTVGRYKEGQTTITINSGTQTTQSIEVQQKPLGTLNVAVKDETGDAISGVPVNLYNTGNAAYYGNTIYTDSNGEVTFEGLPLDDNNLGQFDWYTYAGSHANKNGRVSFTNDGDTKSLTITLETVMIIKGKVLGEDGQGLKNVEIWAAGDNGWATTRTSSDETSAGEYTLRGLSTGTYTVSVNAINAASDGKSYLSAEKDLTAQSMGDVFGLDYNFNLIVASKIKGTVTKLTSSAAPAAGIYVRAEPVEQGKDEYGWPTPGRATTDNAGHFEMNGLKPGDYRVIVDYVQGFEDYLETVTVNQGETLTHNPQLLLTGGDKAFYGEGNSLKADRNYVAPGGVVNLVVNYKNNNTIPLINPAIKVVLPQGFIYVGSSQQGVILNGNTVTKNIGAVGVGQSGSFSFAARAQNVVDGQTYTASAKAEWRRPNGTPITETFGVASMEALSITINGPDKVATNKVRLYGEASSDAEVYIYMDNELKQVVRASGRYWSADVGLGSVGEHTFYAQSKRGDQVSNATQALTVKYSRNLLALEKSTITAGWNGTVEVNPQIGIVTMSVSQGQTMTVKAKIPPNRGIDVNSNGVTFTFAGKNYKAKPSADNWYQAEINVDFETSGTKQLAAKFTDTNGIPESYNIPIANIIILVDPSGYVFDVVEGDDVRIPGVTMTLEVNEGIWKFWNAAMFGQVNPQITTDEGRYGWDVPGGPDEASPIYYLVKAIDPSGTYAAYATDKQAKWKENNTGIAVPPPRFDVNIGLVDQTAPNVVSSSPAANETGIAIGNDIQITFSKKMDKTLVEAPGNIKVSVFGGAEISGTVSYDEASKVATFTPDSVLDDSTKYQVTVAKAIKSAHGITALTNAEYVGDYKTYIDKYNKPLADNATWTFTTAVTPPAVASIDPVGGATNVSIDKSVVVTFNKKMDAATLTAANVKLKNGAAEVSSNLSYDSSTRKLTINPNSALANSTLYQLDIKDAKDTKGNTLPNYSSTFTTEAASGGDPGGPSGPGGGGIFIPPTQANKDTAKVDNTGGNVSLLDGQVSMQIAEGTFSTEVNITIEKVAEGDVALPQAKSTSRFMIAGEIFEIDAGGSDFHKPVTLTFKYDEEKVKAAKNIGDQNFDTKKLGVYYYNTQTGQWDYVGGKVNINNETITIELNHFSKYAVMYLEKTFTDILMHWAKNDIELMASRHIAAGVSETQFGPDLNMTRAQFAALLLRVLGLEEEPVQMSSFTDVPNNAWYAAAVETAFKAGLVGGISQTEFAPNANITREQMAVMIMRTYGMITGTNYEELVLSTKERFADENAISSWAHQAVILASDLRIVGGMTATTFVPKSDATRAQGIVMIKRLLEATNSF